MSGVNGARGPLNCHGQSSGPIRRYGRGKGDCTVLDIDHLRTKLVLLLEGDGGLWGRLIVSVSGNNGQVVQNEI